MRAKIVTAGDYRSLEEALLRDITGLKKDSPLSPVSILTGSNLQGRYLRTLIARRLGGIFNVDFLTFPDLLARLEERSGIPPVKGLPPFAAHAIVEGLSVSGEAPGYFSSISDTRGFPEAVIAAFSDLSEAGCTREIAALLAGDKGTGHGLKALLTLFAAYRKRVDESGGDIHTRFERMPAGNGGGTFDGPLLVYGLYDLNERQWNLLECMENSAAVTLYVPWRDETCFRFAGPLVKRCAARGFDHEAFVREAPEGPWPADIRILSVLDPEAEALEIARRVLESGEKGIRFGEMAVAYPPGYKSGMIREILEESGIPFCMDDRSLLESCPEARGALQLCGLMSGGFSRSQLVEFMVSAPLAAMDSGCAGDPLAAWVRKSAMEGMTGERGWLEENALLKERLSREIAAGRGEQDAFFAAGLAGDIIERIIAAGKSSFDDRSWSSLVKTLSSLVTGLFTATRERDEVCAAIDGLSSLDSLPGGMPARLFPALVERTLAFSRGFTGRPGGEGVLVLPLGGIRGLRFRVIFIAGMTEDSIPGTPGRDPFLPDDARELVEKMQCGRVRFPRRSGRTAELELVFMLSCMSAGDRLVCSYPRSEAGSGREKTRSSFLNLLEAAARRDRERGESIVSRVPGGIGKHEKRIPVSEDEYCLMSAAEHGVIPGDLPGRLFFSRGTELEKSRWSKYRLTPYDGVLESPEAAQKLAAMLDEKGSYSATSLERWARCPFAFFLKNILKIESVEEPERILTIDALQRGALVHSLLQRLYASLGENGLLPAGADRTERVDDHASRFIAEYLEDYSSRSTVGVGAFWEIDKSRIIRAVKGLLSSEAREEVGMVPILYEEPFGRAFGASAVSFDTGTRRVSFHGRIDRIDRNENGRFRVIDYKTGRLSGKDDDMGGGTALQLPVYLLAASVMLALPVKKGSAQYRRVSGDGGKMVVSFDGSRWNDLGRELGVVLDVIVGGIRDGLFFMYPDETGCGFCEMRGACPSSRRLLFEQKTLNDPRAGDYLAMRGRVSEDA